MKWPQAWVAAILDDKDLYWFGRGDLLTDKETKVSMTLEALHSVGALKDLPKPKEVWMCKRCLIVGESISNQPADCHADFNRAHAFIRMREVIE